MIEEVPEREQAEFNMAVSYLGRLNYWFYNADMASAELQVYEWFQAICVLFRELGTYMEQQEKSGQKMKLRILFQKVSNHVIISRSRKLGNQVPPDLYWELDSMEEFLREVAKKSGLQMKMKEHYDIKGL